MCEVMDRITYQVIEDAQASVRYLGVQMAECPACEGWSDDGNGGQCAECHGAGEVTAEHREAFLQRMGSAA